MKAIKLKSLCALTLVSIFAVFVGPAGIHAQDVGVQISPTKNTIDANPGDKKQVVILLKNPNPKPQKVNILFNDFTNSDNESGEPKLIDDSIFVHGIKEWLSGPSSAYLSSHASGEYKLTVSVPTSTTPGTYYGMVRFNSGATNASVASLLFVNVGTITQQVAIEEFDVSDIAVSSLNLAHGKFKIRLKNTGNGYTVPKIKIEILDATKAVVETLDANKDEGGILPGDTIRKYTTEFSKNLEPNKTYSAKVTATAADNKPVTQEKTFIEAPVIAAGPTEPPEPKKTNVAIPLIVGVMIALLTAGIITAILLRKRSKPTRMPSAYMSPASNEPLRPTVLPPVPPTLNTPPSAAPEDKPTG